MQMNEEDCRLCMFPDLRYSWNDLSVVNRLAMATSGFGRYRLVLIPKI